MAKKTLDLVIELTKQLYKFDTSFYIPIKYKELKIGWVNKKNHEVLKLIKPRNGFIDANQLIEISKNKSFYTELVKKKNYEFCPVFKQSSFSLKLNFDSYKPFGINKFFEIERSLLAPLGLPQYGIHANGWHIEKSEYIFHFAIRSKKIKHFPGLYDNIFAGGQPSKISIENNLKKKHLKKQV